MAGPRTCGPRRPLQKQVTEQHLQPFTAWGAQMVRNQLIVPLGWKGGPRLSCHCPDSEHLLIHPKPHAFTKCCAASCWTLLPANRILGIVNFHPNNRFRLKAFETSKMCSRELDVITHESAVLRQQEENSGFVLGNEGLRSNDKSGRELSIVTLNLFFTFLAVAVSLRVVCHLSWGKPHPKLASFFPLKVPCVFFCILSRSLQRQ